MPKPARMPERGEVGKMTKQPTNIRFPGDMLTAEEGEAMDRRIAEALDFGYSPPPPKPRLVTVNIPDCPRRKSDSNQFFGSSPVARAKAVPHLTYVVRSGPFVKIGAASDIEARVRSLIAMNPHEVTVLAVLAGGQEVERPLHRRFAAYRHRDEWFRLEGELAAWIDAGCPV